jgi:hypothetical protein
MRQRRIMRHIKRAMKKRNGHQTPRNMFEPLTVRKVKTYYLNKLIPRQRVQAINYLFFRNFDVLKMAGVNVSHTKLPESVGENEEKKPAEYTICFNNNLVERYYRKHNRFWSFRFYYN